MNSRDRVANVMAARVRLEFVGLPDTEEADVYVEPLITTGEYYFSTNAEVESFVRRILAAAGGVEVFTDTVDLSKPRAPKKHRPTRNPEGAAAWVEQKRQRKLRSVTG